MSLLFPPFAKRQTVCHASVRLLWRRLAMNHGIVRAYRAIETQWTEFRCGIRFCFLFRIFLSSSMVRRSPGERSLAREAAKRGKAAAKIPRIKQRWKSVFSQPQPLQRSIKEDWQPSLLLHTEENPLYIVSFSFSSNIPQVLQSRETFPFLLHHNVGIERGHRDGPCLAVVRWS